MAGVQKKPRGERTRGSREGETRSGWERLVAGGRRTRREKKGAADRGEKRTRENVELKRGGGSTRGGRGGEGARSPLLT